eukprot:CAMPEP_0202686668 /NCGR_PEP_ID=MMETSP1385-20130828/2422_1 /ASSEMBLY_ACC=CAM_ASM_000861 /TAXON_ID=933848 /ORGANISM="Elphidium margaritaceum" /LENGTH=220 /DNA_ID=CAMNT_0049341291 /DNA_START=30 /DNA_END=692 /DNA_ORIENTATION=+
MSVSCLLTFFSALSISTSLSVSIGEKAPDFSTIALMPDLSFDTISLSQFKGSWLLLFFYPLDFTFVCPTEIISFSEASVQFKELNTNVIGASVDSQYSHLAWANTPRNRGGLGDIKIPLIADLTRSLSRDYGVMMESEGHSCRGTFIIDPKGIVRHLSMNDPPVGRNVDEYVRLIQAFQYADKNGEVCPAQWKPGRKTIRPDPNAAMEYFESVEAESASK